jgi:hypothetical protein
LPDPIELHPDSAANWLLNNAFGPSLEQLSWTTLRPLNLVPFVPQVKSMACSVVVKSPWAVLRT